MVNNQKFIFSREKIDRVGNICNWMGPLIAMRGEKEKRVLFSLN